MTSYRCNKYEQITPSYRLSVNYIYFSETFCICEAYSTITVGSQNWFRGKSDPKPDYVCKTVKAISEWGKQTRNYWELVCTMDNISVIKMTRVVIVSAHVTLTEISKTVTTCIKPVEHLKGFRGKEYLSWSQWKLRIHGYSSSISDRYL